MFRAFRSRNYRLFFGGQSISLVGTWMQNVAMQLLVYRLTHSTALLGIISLVSQLPAFLVSPFAGVWLDEWDRRKVIVATQTLSGLQAGVLAILVFGGWVQVWHLVALSVVLGMIGAFDMPGRQAFLIEMVHDREDLQNAIALNSSQFNIARLIGPALAGFVITVMGEKVCFAANAVSYIAVVWALLAMRVPRHTKKIREQTVLQQLADGWHYTRKFTSISSLLILLAAVSFSSGMFSVLLPALAVDYFKGNSAATLSYLYVATAIGALAGAMWLAARKTIIGLGTVAMVAALVYGLGTIAFGVAPTLWSGLVILLFAGYGGMVNMAATNTLLQTLVDERMRGRVMSFYTMSFIGTMPVGAFLGGFLAGGIGLMPTCFVAGSATIIAAAWFYWRLPLVKAHARPVLQERGILPIVEPDLAEPEEVPS
ncbi:MAG TPA: MFS transporter [Fimbriimonadaceae bacterium]